VRQVGSLLAEFGRERRDGVAVGEVDPERREPLPWMVRGERLGGGFGGQNVTLVIAREPS